jgi:hypothetical protein
MTPLDRFLTAWNADPPFIKIGKIGTPFRTLWVNLDGTNHPETDNNYIFMILAPGEEERRRRIIIHIHADGSCELCLVKASPPYTFNIESTVLTMPILILKTWLCEEEPPYEES